MSKPAEKSEAKTSAPVTSRRAPATQEALLNAFLNDPTQSDRMSNIVVPIHAFGPNQTPLAPIERPGHFEFLPISLQPNVDVKEIIPVNELEKSSSSFLKDIQTPPSTPSDEEKGRIGMKCPWIKHKHHVSHIYKDKWEADRFGSVLLFFVMLTKIPTLILQLLYVFNTTFRYWMVESSTLNVTLFCLMLCISIFLKYVSGLARHYPYHLIMIGLKALCFTIMYTAICSCTESFYIMARIEFDGRYDAFTLNESLYPALFKQYMENHFHQGIIDDNDKDDPLLLYGDSFTYEIYQATPNIMYLVGIGYGLLMMILAYCLITFSKISFFGPGLTLITFTSSFALIIFSSMWTMHAVVVVPQNLPWALLQSIGGFLIGLLMIEKFVDFLDNLFAGKLCPLQPHEFFYAAAHY